jgi:molecular chaperone DnaK
LFTCYARADRERLRLVHKALLDAGHQGWFDGFILAGEDWKARLQDEIQVCDAFLYAISSASIASEWCAWELARAIELGKPVVPVLLEVGVDLPNSVAHLHFADLTTTDAEDNLRRLLGGLARMGRAVSRPTVRETPHGVPAQVAWRNATTVRQPIGQLGADNVSADSGSSGGAGWRPGPCVGIDFGTVTSLVAILDNGRPQLVANRLGQLGTPSAVGIDLAGVVVVGEVARNLALVHPDRAELYPKRLFGTTRKLYVDGVAYSGPRLASYVLKQLRDDAAEYLGDPIGGAVITAPASFTAAELADLSEAARLADLRLLRVVAEPTAACLAWGIALDDAERRVVVFDLGGGTFDVSVLETGEGVVEVRSIVGDAHLGGRDYDRALADYCVAEFLSETGVDLSADPVALMRIRDACETTKVALSSVDAGTVTVPFIHGDAGGTYNLAVPITRHQFEDLTYHLTDATIDACRTALEGCGVAVDSIDELLLVGLATRTPMVRESAEHYFDKRARRDLTPDAIVALGAAVQAGVLTGSVTDILLLDARAHDIAVETQSGASVVVVPAGTTIPTRRRCHLTTTNEQSVISVRLAEHGSRRVPVAEMIIDHVPTGGRYPPLLEVEADIDLNSDVHVVARVLGTDLEISSDTETSTRPGLPAALPIALSEPVAARQILIEEIYGPEQTDLTSTVEKILRTIQGHEPNVVIQRSDRYRNETLHWRARAISIAMYAGDRSTASSIVDAVTAKVSRALRDAKINIVDTTTEPPAASK